MIKQKKLTVLEVSRVYDVSQASVYRWLHQYGDLPKNERMVVEKTSEETKNLELLKRIRDLEAEIGRLHIDNVLQSKIIECGSDILGEDLKKKYFTGQSK